MPSTITVAQLSTIIDAVPTAIVVVDGQGRIESVNAQAARLFGYTSAELLGETIENLVPYRLRAQHPRLREGYLHAPQTRPMGAGRDLFGLRKDGTEFPIEIGLNPITTEEGLLVVSAIVDLSERKRLEARLRATIEAAPTAMVMIDPAGTIVLVNSETERLFGYDRDELRGQKVEVLIPPRFRAHHPGLRAQYLSAPEARRMGQSRDLFGLRKDGSEFPIEIGLNPVASDEGRFVLSAIVDISERTRQANETLWIANEALRHANEDLERSNLELRRFAYIASHDLQTPMRSVTSFVELLSATYADRLDEQAQDWIRRTVRSVHQLRTLIQDLLEYSRIDAAKRPFEDVAMSGVIEDAVALLGAAVSESGAKVVCGELPVVRGDRSQLVQLLLNLIGNAIKYRAAEPPLVTISAERHRDDWVFAVRDNGIGMEEKHHQRIFEIFERLHDPQDYPGTGIGLAVCRRVVHRHGGRIWVESELGRGSAFHFTIAGREAATS